MFYTGLDPYTLQPVFVPRTDHEKAMQRALLQYFDPARRKLVAEALREAGREDLIGNGPECLSSARCPAWRARKPNAKTVRTNGKHEEKGRSRMGGRWEKDAARAARAKQKKDR